MKHKTMRDALLAQSLLNIIRRVEESMRLAMAYEPHLKIVPKRT